MQAVSGVGWTKSVSTAREEPKPVNESLRGTLAFEEGRQIGPYRILSLLASGGMGQLYRAQDLYLGRYVAIKTLPPSRAHDPEQVRRFEHEAHLMAELNHPHIASIYSLKYFEGSCSLIMELLEGPTLADWLKCGPIPIAECLRLGIDLAEALETVHQRGIVHRDIKPANIKITVEGQLKLLDFGLAKKVSDGQPESGVSDTATLSAPNTEQGGISGTAAYMSPDQARGRYVDQRTDIWAFGCVLFEMLTGNRAFNGETCTDILAAVLRDEPEWSAVPPHVPTEIFKLIQTCLAKDVRYRFQTIGRARENLSTVLASFPKTAIGAAARHKSRQAAGPAVSMAPGM